MELQLIEKDMQVFEYNSEIVPAKGSEIKRLHGKLQTWRVLSVRHIVTNVPDYQNIYQEERIILKVKELK